jgi:hypothetical protein
MTPNNFAYFSLIAWPLVALYLYRSRPAAVATMWTILAGQLLLPAGTFFKLEMIPQFDKVSIPNLCALVGCTIAARRPSRLTNGPGVVEVLILLCVVGPLVTSLLNGDPIYIGSTILPGVGVYDGISAVIFQVIMLIPFFLGRHFFRNAADTQKLFSVLSFAGLAYSILLLFEIRFSPQLHNWIYGYYPSDFIQTMREGGGFRPMVFMGHGLVASFFAMTAAVASGALWRTRTRIVKFAPAGAVAAYLSAVLVLCKSGAATVYGMVLVPMVSWTKPRFQMRVAAILVSVALLYPALRMYDVFPTDALVEISNTINEQRASSLRYRFDQEGLLLERASQRFLFGWGRYGRNRVFVEDWRGVGGDSSVTDGLWIIVLGQFGLVGFIAQFGLLAISVFRAAKALKFAESFSDSVFLSALALIVAVNMVDLLPNSALSAWTWLLVGSLLGRSEMILARSRNRKLQKISPLNLQEARA